MQGTGGVALGYHSIPEGFPPPLAAGASPTCQILNWGRRSVNLFDLQAIQATGQTFSTQHGAYLETEKCLQTFVHSHTT